MSTLRCDNFGPSAGGTTYSARGIAKAWVNFNGTGTIATRDSENVSSLTDITTGAYAVNLTNAFGAADYAVSGSVTWDTADYGNTFMANGSGFSASSFRVYSMNNDPTLGPFTLRDALFAMAISHGDLA